MIGFREYRIFVATDTGTLSRDLECADDDSAVQQARRIFPNGLVEVWQGHRLVGRIEPAQLA